MICCMHAGSPRHSVPPSLRALYATAQPSIRRLESACALARPGGRSLGRAAGRERTRGPAPMQPAASARRLLTRPPAHTAAAGPACRRPVRGQAEHRRPRAPRWAPGRRRTARRGRARAPAAPRAGPPGRRPYLAGRPGPPAPQPVRARRGRITHIATLATSCADFVTANICTPPMHVLKHRRVQTCARPSEPPHPCDAPQHDLPGCLQINHCKHPHSTDACAGAPPHVNMYSSFRTPHTTYHAPQHGLSACRPCCAHRKAGGRPDMGEHFCPVLRLDHWHCASLSVGQVTMQSLIFIAVPW